LAQNRNRWQPLGTLMRPRAPQTAGNCLTERLFAFQQRLCSKELAYLLICDLFKDVCNSSDYTASGNRTIIEWWTGRELQGSDCNLIWSDIPAFAWIDWRISQKPQNSWPLGRDFIHGSSKWGGVLSTLYYISDKVSINKQPMTFVLIHFSCFVHSASNGLFFVGVCGGGAAVIEKQIPQPWNRPPKSEVWEMLLLTHSYPVNSNSALFNYPLYGFSTLWFLSQHYQRLDYIAMMAGWLPNCNGFGRKRSGLTHLLSLYLPERAGENHKNCGHDGRYPRWY
jgi:hypothetical protein